jgi:preprotein translocase subunit SecD
MQKQRLILGLILLLVVAAMTVLVKIPMRLGLDLQGGSQLTIEAQPTKDIPKITDASLEDIKKVIENRVNGLGVSEPLVQTMGRGQILVQLPNVSDPQEAEKILGGTAQLDFREQKPDTEEKFKLAIQKKAFVKFQFDALKKSGVKDPAALKEAKAALKKENDSIAEFFTEPKLTGKNLTTAVAEPTNQSENWNVALKFDAAGGKQFADLTKNLAGTGRSIGIFLDSDILSYPIVDAQYKATGISGGSAVINGTFTAREAETLAISLRGGALPVPVEIVENRTVGATLGQESIKSSIQAAIGGLMLVLIFMGVYYRVPGLVANVSLVIYTILSLAAFNLLGVTLTLPGIAGFILSIGMAVDANVLIFERTREELRSGKTLYRSVESGFYRAFSSILDGNLTTLIACLAMFWFGSGLVKGFAFTLGLGVVVSMFTALTCTRTLLLLLVLGFPQLRQMPQLFCPNMSDTTEKPPRLKVIQQRKIWWNISLAVILAGITSMIISSKTPAIGAPLRPSLDFVGGTKLQYELDCADPKNCSKSIDINTIRQIADKQGLLGSTVQPVGKHGFSIRTRELKREGREKLETALTQSVGKLDGSKTQNDTIGPTFGKQLFTNGLLAVGLSFFGIFAYLAFRFQLDYAFFAFVALFHDVFITVGIFSILGLTMGIEVDSLFVVAILTIIGFSVNDTVVIYDRIREVVSLNPNESINKIVQDAVNQTLSRSLNTTLTVLLTLFSIFIFGGETLRNFALCLIIGFTAGAYSSIFIASTLLAWWRVWRERRSPVVADS